MRFQDKPGPVLWRRSNSLVAYPEALAFMEHRVAEIRAGEAEEMVWLLEHPPVYTAGSSARPEDLLEARFPVYAVGRGGKFTYHGPGQRIGYVMLDLGRRGRDVRRFVQMLESWLIGTLAEFGIRGERREGRVGIWVALPGGGEGKIAALGVRVRRWVTYHGVSLNIDPDLSHFGGIVPCGLGQFPVTSMAALGVEASVDAVDAALRRQFAAVFEAEIRNQPMPGEV